jgi:hypothetical protein
MGSVLGNRPTLPLAEARGLADKRTLLLKSVLGRWPKR